MNLNQLKAFVSIVEKGTFSAAARAIGISQPAVSLQIQALEEQIGVELLDRRTKKVQLTEAGSVFYETAQIIVSQLDDVQCRIDDMNDTVKGSLSVGGSTIPGEYVLPRLLGRFKQKFPDVAISLRIADTSEIADLLMEGELQVGLIGAKPVSSQLDYRPFLHDELILIVPIGHELARKIEVSFDDLAGADFIMRERGSGTRQTIEKFMLESDRLIADLPIVMELGSTEAVVNAVSAGLGISIVSIWAAERSLKLGEIEAPKMTKSPILRDLYLAEGKHASTGCAKAFLEFVEQLDKDEIKP